MKSYSLFPILGAAMFSGFINSEMQKSEDKYLFDHNLPPFNSPPAKVGLVFPADAKRAAAVVAPTPLEQKALVSAKG